MEEEEGILIRNIGDLEQVSRNDKGHYDFTSGDEIYNLSGANLEGADLEGANLTSAILIDSIFDSVNLNHSKFTNADLTNASLCDSSLFDAKFNGADLSGADFTGALLSLNAAKSMVKAKSLKGTNFSFVIRDDEGEEVDKKL